MTIAELAADKVATSSDDDKKSKKNKVTNALELIVSDLIDAKKKELDIDGGVKVDLVNDSAARVDLLPGDVIQRLNNTDKNGYTK